MFYVQLHVALRGLQKFTSVGHFVVSRNPRDCPYAHDHLLPADIQKPCLPLVRFDIWRWWFSPRLTVLDGWLHRDSGVRTVLHRNYPVWKIHILLPRNDSRQLRVLTVFHHLHRNFVDQPRCLLFNIRHRSLPVEHHSWLVPFSTCSLFELLVPPVDGVFLKRNNHKGHYCLAPHLANKNRPWWLFLLTNTSFYLLRLGLRLVVGTCKKSVASRLAMRNGLYLVEVHHFLPLREYRYPPRPYPLSSRHFGKRVKISSYLPPDRTVVMPLDWKGFLKVSSRWSKRYRSLLLVMNTE